MLVMVLHYRCLQGFPGCPCSTSCSPPRQEVRGRRAAEVLRRWQEIPQMLGSEPRQTQQRLLVPLRGCPWRYCLLKDISCLLCPHHCIPPSWLLHGLCQRLAVLSPPGTVTALGDLCSPQWEQCKLWAENTPFHLSHVMVSIFRPLLLFQSDGLMAFMCAHWDNVYPGHRGWSSKPVMWRTTPPGRCNLPPGSCKLPVLRWESTAGLSKGCISWTWPMPPSTMKASPHPSCHLKCNTRSVLLGVI